MEESLSALDKLAGIETPPQPPAKATPPATPDAKPAAKPDAKKQDAPLPTKAEDKPEGTPEPEPSGEPAPQEGEPGTAVPEPKGGLGKVLTHFKKEAKRLELENVELRKQVTDPKLVSGLRTELDTTKAQLKELQDKLYAFDYRENPEFREKYIEPYNDAYRRALATIEELTVTDEEGNQRAGRKEDLLPILQLPFGKALELAQRMFGEEAGRYVMSAHYNKVRELADAQLDAIEKAKKNGAEQVRQRTESQQRMIAENFEKFKQFSQEDEAKYEFLKPKEGDDEWNGVLKKSAKFVEEAFAGNPNDPKLSTDEREAVIRRRVAAVNRAKAFSMLRLDNKRMRAELTKLQKQLDGYKNVQPGGGEGVPGGGDAAAAGINDMDQAEAALEALAR